MCLRSPLSVSIIILTHICHSFISLLFSQSSSDNSWLSLITSSGIRNDQEISENNWEKRRGINIWQTLVRITLNTDVKVFSMLLVSKSRLEFLIFAKIRTLTFFAVIRPKRANIIQNLWLKIFYNLIPVHLNFFLLHKRISDS